MASTRVVSIGELVENILVFLPRNEVVTAQQVSRLWRDAVAGSHTLRQIFFIAPRRETTVWTVVKSPCAHGIPHLDDWSDRSVTDSLKANMAFVGKTASDLLEIDIGNPVQHVHVVQFNPFIFGRQEPRDHRQLEENIRFRATTKSSFRIKLYSDRNRINDSREQMYITQPPCQEVDFRARIVVKSHPEDCANAPHHSYCNRTYEDRVHDEDGVKMRHIIQQSLTWHEVRSQKRDTTTFSLSKFAYPALLDRRSRSSSWMRGRVG